ncbi:hypothetical protein LXL04_003163 [Taraxacum kok-saghyz]
MDYVVFRPPPPPPATVALVAGGGDDYQKQSKLEIDLRLGEKCNLYLLEDKCGSSSWYFWLRLEIYIADYTRTPAIVVLKLVPLFHEDDEDKSLTDYKSRDGSQSVVPYFALVGVVDVSFIQTMQSHLIDVTSTNAYEKFNKENASRNTCI